MSDNAHCGTCGAAFSSLTDAMNCNCTHPRSDDVRPLTAAELDAIEVTRLINALIDTAKAETRDLLRLGSPSGAARDERAAAEEAVHDAFNRMYATARAGLEDRERLDWLDGQKSSNHATWASPPVDEDGGGGPAYWRDPSVSWTVSRKVKCGVYEFPQELADARVREAIDTQRRSPRSGYAAPFDPPPQRCACGHSQTQHREDVTLDGVWHPCTVDECRCGDFHTPSFA